MDAPVGSTFAALPAWQQRFVPLAIAVLRITFGLLFFTNGLAKVSGFEDINYAPFPGFLIDYDGARNSIDSDTRGHPIPIYRDLIENLVLDHYTPFGVGLVLAELAMGAALIFGVFASAAALGGFLSLFHLWFANWGRYHSQEIWAWEGPVEWLPLLGLVFLASGRFYGLDRRVEALLPPRLRRWPLVR
ncbi:MAG: hypothetical protein ACKVVT_17410 [Dehalococcoidia bacterium]